MAKLKIPHNYEIVTKIKLENILELSGAVRSDPLGHYVIIRPGFFDRKGQISTTTRPFQKMILWLNLMDGESSGM